MLLSVKAAHQAIMRVTMGARALSIEIKETDNVKKATKAVMSVPLASDKRYMAGMDYQD